MNLLQPRRFHPRKVLFVLAVLVAYAVYIAQRDRPLQHVKWTGQTMGSTYTVQIVVPAIDAEQLSALQASVHGLFEGLNAEFSTWRPDSPINRFNHARAGKPIKVSLVFADLLRKSIELARVSGGAFDVTFSPMFDAWGFGRSGPKRVPTDEEFAAALARCGWTNLTISADGFVTKHVPGMEVVFNAIVPGYAAERVTDWLASRGFTNTYVDVGGDAVVRGANPMGRSWRIGIERPLFDADPGEKLQTIVDLTDAALATAGDYRNYFRGEDGRLYSHIFDPRIGRPATSRVASVSVIATNGGLADALATTLFVMGPDEGLPWLTNFPGAEALFLMREGDDAFHEVSSPGFAAKTRASPATL